VPIGTVPSVEERGPGKDKSTPTVPKRDMVEKYHNYPLRGKYFKQVRNEKYLINRLAESTFMSPILIKKERHLLRHLLSCIIPRIRNKLHCYRDRAYLDLVYDGLVDIFNVDLLLRYPDKDVSSRLVKSSYSRKYSGSWIKG